MHQQEQDTPIEQIQIKGLTVKQFVTVLAIIISFVFTAALIYARIINQNEIVIDKLTDMTKQWEIMNKKIETNSIQLQTNEIWKARMEEKLEPKK